MAEGDGPIELAEAQALAIQRVNQRLDMLDQRLDNIDSIVTAVAERVMNQLITINITCPYCSKDIEVGLMGSQKPKR